MVRLGRVDERQNVVRLPHSALTILSVLVYRYPSVRQHTSDAEYGHQDVAAKHCDQAGIQFVVWKDVDD